jgi:alcohol dehydrogenase (cytochrome c)
VVKDKVIVGVAGGDTAAGGIRGFVAAFDAQSGREAWRFYTVPAPGEPGSETWPPNAWKTGGAGPWNTGSYDPDLNLIYWGTGNPAGFAYRRPGDNLYSDSVVALDADTGKLRWHYQFTPNDDWDLDAAQVPILADIDWQGRPRKAMLWANENGLYYVIDRVTGEFLLGKPFVPVRWMTGFGERGRPNRIPEGKTAATRLFNGLPHATNWTPGSYSPETHLFFFSAQERGSDLAMFARGGGGSVRAVDATTGEERWQFKQAGSIFFGELTTASGLLFSGADEGCHAGANVSVRVPCLIGGGDQGPTNTALLSGGRLYAIDAATGQMLWQTSLGGSAQGPPMTYAVEGKQFVTITAGNTLLAFALKP